MSEHMSYSLGRIGIFARGAYNPFESYEALDVVSFNGSSYVATQASEGEMPSADSVYWKLLAERGEQGVQGPKGDGGQSFYTWLKYADSPTSGMSDDPTGKKYIGLAYNKLSASESSDYDDYTWCKIQGEKGDTGVPGAKGSDGSTFYTWIKYADNASGTNMSDDPDGKAYIGLAYNKSSAAESSNPSDYTWSLIQGERGPQGPQGPKGDVGVGIANVSMQYYISTSKESPVDGAWSSTPPAWVSGKYLWTRTAMSYTNGQIVTTSPVCDSAWEAVLQKEPHIGPSAPMSPVQGKLWMDTGVTPHVLRIYDGSDPSTNGWSPVTDNRTLEAANEVLADQLSKMAAEMEGIMTSFDVDTAGAHIYKNKDTNEVLITDKDVQVLVAGTAYSKFLAAALQLGDFRLWQPACGGLAFAPIEGR